MKVHENISSLNEADKATLTRVINELIPLRKSKEHTESYYDTFLSADIRRKQLENKTDFFLNDREIEVSKAREFRSSLLEVIKDDKDSFGYLYFFLGSEVNREYKDVMYDCVPSSKTISYCVDFDLDELQSRLNSELDLNKRLDIIDKQAQESDKHKYTGEYKDRFKEFCKSEIERINQKIKVQEPKQSQDTLTALTKNDHVVRMKLIYTYLKGEEFINCSENDFLYWFGLKTLPKKPQKIKWLKADSVLKNVVHHICGKSGEKYINTAFIFKNKYVTTNYEKDYVCTAMFKEIQGYLYYAVPKI